MGLKLLLSEKTHVIGRDYRASKLDGQIDRQNVVIFFRVPAGSMQLDVKGIREYFLPSAS